MQRTLTLSNTGVVHASTIGISSGKRNRNFVENKLIGSLNDLYNIAGMQFLKKGQGNSG